MIISLGNCLVCNFSGCFWLVNRTNLLSKQNISFASNRIWKKNLHLPANCTIRKTHICWMEIRLNACLALSGAARGYQKKKSIKNCDWSHFEVDAVVENLAFFISSWKIKISSAWLLPDARYTRLKIYITSPS